MLRSIHHLYDYSIGALDGDIGHIKDVYFDDLRWAARYLVIDTGSWLTGRQVLITPHACSGLDHAGKRLLVKLTRKQIEDSPLIETHKPVSRQFEHDFYNYYGLPFYWQGDMIWGLNTLPLVVDVPRGQHPYGVAAADQDPVDPHLRSTVAVHGYHIQASDGDIGHINDFLIDETDWAIRQLVVKTGGWLSGSEVLIPTNRVERVVYEESTVHVGLTMAAVRQSPPFQAVALAAST